MPSPRFARLPSEQRQAIERAALTEFAAHGFHDASLNRMIQAAGISKGSLYYYFDGKEDLYAHVARTGLEALFERLGSSPLPATDSPDAYWNAITELYLRAMAGLATDPELAALLRGWSAATATPAGQGLLRELEAWVMPWLIEAVAQGQRVGAVRTDVPTGLLLAVATGMGQAMDLWMLDADPDPAELPHLTTLLIGMLRGALQPAT